jgi:preprotein translocase subunit Sec61beta
MFYHYWKLPEEKRGSGFQSAAGLIRYFEEEEDLGPILDPKLVLYIAIMFGVVIALLKVFWPI